MNDMTLCMFLAINISAFEMEFALLNDEGKIVSKFSISTQNKKTSDQYASEIKNVFDYLQVNKNEITHVAILSTIPKFNHIVYDFLKKYLRIEPITIQNTDVPLAVNENTDISVVPVDVLAGCYACNKHYGNNIVFINFDEIITFATCVDSKFYGYVVFPGMDILANAVHLQNSEYPEIVIKPTQEIYSVKRYDALNCGVFNGVMGACDNIVNSITSHYDNKQFQVIATCKRPELLQYSQTINIIDQDLRIKSVVEVAKHQLLAI